MKVLASVMRWASSMQVGIALFIVAMVLSLVASLSPGLGAIYHSLPFELLLGLLVLNTGFCTLRQAPKLWRRRHASWPLRLRAWSVWLIHAAILVVAVGSFWSSMAAKDGSVALAEGETATIPEDLGGGKAWQLSLLRFRTETNPDGSPAGWWSQVSLSSGETVYAQDVEIGVNRPLEQGGLSILQASFGVRYLVSLEQGGERREYQLEPGDFLPFDAAGRLGVLLQSESRGAADQVDYLAIINGQVAGPGRAKRGVPVEIDGEGLRFTVERLIPTSGLRLRYDPAVPLVWLGFGLLALSISALFIMPKKEVS